MMPRQNPHFAGAARPIIRQFVEIPRSFRQRCRWFFTMVAMQKAHRQCRPCSSSRRAPAHVVVATALACVMALSGFPVVGPTEEPAHAFADETADAEQALDDAQLALESAEARMTALTAQYEAIKRESDELQKRISEMAAQALEAQQALIEGREALGKTAVQEYLSGGSAQSLLTLVLESTDFNDLVRNMAYLDAIMRRQAEDVAEQKERSDHFDKLILELDEQKDAQDEKLRTLEQKKTEAERVVAGATEALSDAQDDYAARLEELKRKADEMANSGEPGGPIIVDGANTVDRPEAVGPDAEVQPNPDPAPPAPAPEPEVPTPTPGDTVGWLSGAASAYGGATDPYTPNPGTTATGAVCDDWSMGVAIPMAWDHYWQYYGRTVEISYGGQTVFAVVNDCGGLNNGERSLDLQPGVWKAFGATSCQDWGVRTVSYRFL